jgi:hypothetical protein
MLLSPVLACTNHVTRKSQGLEKPETWRGNIVQRTSITDDVEGAVPAPIRRTNCAQCSLKPTANRSGFFPFRVVFLLPTEPALSRFAIADAVTGAGRRVPATAVRLPVPREVPTRLWFSLDRRRFCSSCPVLSIEDDSERQGMVARTEGKERGREAQLSAKWAGKGLGGRGNPGCQIWTAV